MLGQLSRKASFANSIDFYINGKRYILNEGEFNPLMTLANYLRSDEIKLKGTKIGCEEGGCGACTVLVSSLDPISGDIKHRSVNSCLMPLAQAHHTSITTVEALGSLREGIHPVQQSIVAHHGTQCGFCTPGFVMNAYAMLLENPNPTTKQIEEQFDGNLCRCTGYRSIADALREFSSDTKPIDKSVVSPLNSKVKVHQDPIIPHSIREPIKQSVKIQHGDATFYIPSTMEELIQIKNQNPKAKIIVGNSEIGIDTKNRGASGVYISALHVNDLLSIEIKDDKLIFGASTPLQDLMHFCEKKQATLPEEKCRVLREIKDRLRVFSSTQIRNTASVVGNIAYAGAVTDLSNFLLASDSVYSVINAETQTKKTDSIDDFFVGYRKTKLNQSDVISRFEVPLLKKDEHIFCFKQGRRRDDDICLVSATIKAKVNEKSNIIEDIKIAYSGMAAFPQRAKKTENFLKGKQFTIENINSAFKYIHEDLPLAPNAPGGHVQFRKELAESFLFRFFHATEKERGRPYDPSASDMIDRPIPKFSLFGVDKKLSSKGHTGDPIHHRSAIQQTTGEAVYVDDIPSPKDCLHGGYVLSSIPSGKIKSIDYSKALKYPGVVDVVTAEDIRGINLVGDVWKDEPVYAKDEVSYIGQPIAMILAESNEAAWAAAKLVDIKYEEKRPVLSIEQAIAENSFYDSQHYIQRGEPNDAFKKCDKVITGQVEVGAQSHFYLETNACLVEYLEDDHLRVTSSSQNPTFGQMEISRVNGIPANKIEFHVKRMGGGFGGKETRSSTLTNSASVAAMKVKRPVRLSLDRQTDMSIIGTRHPCLSKFKAGFTRDGYVKAIEFDHYFDCGWSYDLSLPVSDRCLFHSDGSYYIENMLTKSHLCKTNQITGTAFRGFGGPQGTIAIESVMEAVARELKMPVELVRWRNLYQEGQTTHFHVPLLNCNVRRSWELIDKKFNLAERRKAVDDFNLKNKYKKRGLSLTPLKFGIAFTLSPLNQGNCLIHIYKDGSVLLSHGGTEMGQGLHTKMCQIAATILDIPVELVRIDDTSTDKCANTSPTAASSGSDLNGHAVYNAAIQLKERLRKFRTPGKTWADSCKDAYWAKTDLSAHGYYSMPDVSYDWQKHEGKPFQYYTYGASASEVEIDCLTGDHQVIRTDAVFDVGDSLNIGIDVGQLEGAFLQGYGYLTMEEFIKGDFTKNQWVKPGKVHTNGPGFYKIPGFNDLPHEFNMGFLQDSGNPVGIFSSKAIGEPPFLLANSIGFALVDALRASRKEHGLSPDFNIEFPLSAPTIRNLSGTKL